MRVASPGRWSSFPSGMDSNLEAFSYNPALAASPHRRFRRRLYRWSELVVPLVLNQITVEKRTAVG